MDRETADSDSKNEIPLSQLVSLSEEHRELLGKQWITSVEGLLGICSTETVRESVAGFLGMSPSEFDLVVKECIELLGAEESDKIMRLSSSERPLGLVLTDEQRVRFREEPDNE